MYKSTKSITWTTQKIIALLLLGLSFIMFFLPWMSISVKYRGERYSFGELVEYAAGLDGYSKAEIKEELYDTLYDASDDLEEEGIKLNPDRAMKIFEMIMDSKFSPFDVVRLCSFSGGLLRQFNRYLNDNIDYLYWAQAETASAIKEASVKVTLATVFMIILLIVVLAGFLLGVYMILTDKKLGIIPYLAGVVLFFLVFTITTISANSQMKQAYNSSSLGYSVSDMFSDMGVNISSSALNIFHITAAGIFCVLFAVGALCTVLLVKRMIPAGTSMRSVIEKKWICPSCGGTMDMGAAFCYKCGTKRPEAKRCVKCGSPLENGAAFCINCGTPVAGSGYSGREPDVREEKKICVKCGSPVEKGAAFCIKCGTPVAGSGYPGREPGVREEKKICSRCGSTIENGSAFCTRCGTPVAGSGYSGHSGPVSRVPASEPRKTCPACGKSIPETATVCSFCGYDFNKKFWGTLSKPTDDDML